jgi:hypothetical protein
MPSGTPAVLPTAIRKEISSMVLLATESGWQIGIIYRESVTDKTVSFGAKSPSGNKSFTLCGEDDLCERLRSLFASHGTP